VRFSIAARLKATVLATTSGHACGLALANKGHDPRALQAYLRITNI
jgi:hypothetical protein